MDLGIAGLNALVLGGSKDVGRAIACDLVNEGCNVTAVARDGEALSELQAFGIQIRALDVSETNQVISQVERPDIIVHVVGGSVGIKDSQSTADDYAKVWKHNLGNAITINNAFLPAMLEKGWGRIVHFSSNGVKLAIGNSPYTSAKAAIEGYVRTVSKELASKGVVMTAVSPGPIFTEGRWLYSQPKDKEQAFFDKYVNMNRWGKPEELSKVVTFLCSNHSSYMAGAIVDVSGGMR